MKKFRKLIPATAMLLISALLMGTSTFAWFSLNKTVSATGMQVTAKNESIYLLISNTAASDTAAKIQAENSGKGFTTVSATVADPLLIPAALATEATKVDVKEVSIADYSVPGNWYTAYALDASASAVNTATEKKLTTFTGYVFEYTYRFTLAAGSIDASNLKVTTCEMTAAGGKNIDAARALVVCGTNVEEFTPSKTSGTVNLAADVTDSDVVEVKVYIYCDGNDTSIFTNNVANLDGATINLTFGVD